MDDAVPSSYSRPPDSVPPRPRIATLADAAQRRPITLVLGMHRSGTSLCANILSLCGIDMTDQVAGPELSESIPSNARGHWERVEIVEFHNRILDIFNRHYYGPFHDFPLPAGWWAEPRVSQIRREMTAFLKRRMDDGPFGFKDPRTVRLMPLWRQIFAELKLAPKIVLCLRNPAQVARSLHARDGIDPLLGEYRWLVHMLDFFRYIGDFEYFTIEYESWFAEPEAYATKLLRFLDIELSLGRFEFDQALGEIVDASLRHDDTTRVEASEPLVRRFYRLAAAAGQDGAARRQIQELVSQFVGFERMQRRFHQAYETASAIAARLPASEAEIAGLRNAAAERDAALEAAGRRATAADEALDGARADIETLRVALIEAESTRDAVASRADAAEAALAAAYTEAEHRRARLAELEDDRGDLIGRTEAAESRLSQALDEIAVHHRRLAEAEDDREAALGRADAAEARLVQTQTTIEAGLGRIAALEIERDTGALALAAAKSALDASEARDVERTAKLIEARLRSAEAATALAAAVEAAEQARRELQAASAEHEAAAAAFAIELNALRTAVEESASQNLCLTVAAETAEAGLAQTRSAFEAERDAAARQAESAVAELAASRERQCEAEAEYAEQAAAAATMRSESAALHEQLAAARLVGTRLVAAFCVDAAPPPQPDTARPRWWRRALGLERWRRTGAASS